jgi:hypothetical protein
MVALLVPAAPAWGQDDHQPVVGGGSFNAAPILEPGRYRDTLLPSEYLYYAFRLEPGQRLHLTANADMRIEDLQALGVSFVTANFHSPTRTQYITTPDYDVRGSFRAESEPALDITGPYASADEDTSETGQWYGPGVYYIAFYAVHTGAGDPPRAEIPFHFEVQVDGAATATPTASPSRTPTPSPTPTATPVPEDSGVAPGIAGLVGVGGLLAGALGGIALRRRRR